MVTANKETAKRLAIERMEAIERHIKDLRNYIKDLEADYTKEANKLINDDFGEEYIPDGIECGNCKRIKRPQQFKYRADGSRTKTCIECLESNIASKRRKGKIRKMSEVKDTTTKSTTPKPETLEEYMARLTAEGKTYREKQIAETIWLQKHGWL